MSYTDTALTSHINALKAAVRSSDSLEERFAAAVLLADLYERMLMQEGVIVADEDDEDEVLH